MTNVLTFKIEIEGLEDLLVGPTAVVLSSEDYLEPLKAVYEYAKNNETYKIKGGVIDGKVMTTEELITLAKLPSRETLISMLAGALLGNISKLAVGLNEVCKQKENVSRKNKVNLYFRKIEITNIYNNRVVNLNHKKIKFRRIKKW